MENKLTKQIGQYVSFEYYKKNSLTYKSNFINNISNVTVENKLIEDTLKSPNVVGISFFYGLLDELNPNSLRIFMVPCYENSDNIHHPVLQDEYIDNNGVKYSIVEICKHVASFTETVSAKTIEKSYKKITRGCFFGKEKLLDLIGNPNSHYLKLHLGYKNEIIHLILESLDSTLNPHNIFMNRGTMPLPSDWEGDCIATLATEIFSSQNELDLFRAFRDKHLLKMDGGSTYFELYYMISPFITYLISERKDKNTLLKEIYYDKISLFKSAIIKNNNLEAYEILKDTLNEWIETFSISKGIKV